MFDLNISQLISPLPDKTDVVEGIIKINQSEISKDIGIISIEIDRSFNRVASARIVVRDGSVTDNKFTISDQDTFTPGNQVEILAGYLPQLESIFKGIIIKHALRIDKKGRSNIEIDCRDSAVKMTVGRKNRYFFDDTDSGIIENIARDHNLNINIESTDLRHAEMVQYFCTDWDFILSRAEANGKLVLTNDGELVLKSPDFDQTPYFTVNYGTSLFEFEAEMDARNQYPSVKAMAWAPSSQEIIETTFSPTGANPSTSPPNTDYSSVIGIPNFQVQHSGALSPEELQSWAEAQFLKSKISKSRGRVKIAGTSRAKPGKIVSLQGVGARHSGPVFVTAVRHEITNGSWYTHFQFGLSHQWLPEIYEDVQEKPASKLLPGVCGLQIGIVTKLENDPDGEFRIQLRLPIIDKLSDGIWARIALQDAGDQRSAFFMPEIGDEVIVGFINDDPRDAIVLGMLHSSAKASPIQADDQNNVKGWQTRSGIKMLFDDDKKSWTLNTPSGKKIVVDDDADNIILEDQNGNKLTMDSSGIQIEAFKDLTLKAQGDVKVEGINIKHEASATLVSKGNGSAELSATGEVVVKGGIVRIN